METRVLKFGGTSVATPERIRSVARIVEAHRKAGARVVVVVSAMGHATDELIRLAKDVSPLADQAVHRREMDMLLSTGERVSMALLSMALSDIGVPAVSFTGSQSGIITDTIHGEARIAEIRPIRLVEALEAGKVVIVAGFQGVSREKEITTLGRGGSDTTAVALASVLGASRALIYTDVDGVYSADPRVVPGARKLKSIGWDVALAATERGAQVLHPRCVEIAWKKGMPIQVLSAFGDPNADSTADGTMIEGVAMTSLEGSQVLNIAVQEGLVQSRRKCGSAERASGFRRELTEAGVKVLEWESGEGLAGVIVDADSKARLPKEWVSETSFSRVSLVGIALGQDIDLQETVREVLAEKNCEPLRVKHQAMSIEVWLPESTPLREIAAALHEALVNNK